MDTGKGASMTGTLKGMGRLVVGGCLALLCLVSVSGRTDHDSREQVVTLGPASPVSYRSSAGATMASRLAAWVHAMQAEESAAGTSRANIWGEPVLHEVSPPARDGHRVLAVVAFSFDPGGHPVRVLSYARNTWSQVAALAAPSAPGTLYHAGSVLLVSDQTPVGVAKLSGLAHPAFLIQMAAAGCGTGALVAPTGAKGAWRFVPFSGPFPTGDTLGGNPQVSGGSVRSDNDCVAGPVPASQRVSWVWTYHAHPGNMVGVRHAGWSDPPM
jgi:hypothetical protein